MTKHYLSNWNPENDAYWESTASKVAARNLWCSIPCLFIAFAVWFIWSAVAVELGAAGFNFTKNQLFTLAAMPGLIGATLRIIYSFTVPVFGGKNWTVFSTVTLLIPAIGIGFAVQDPSTSYEMMLLLAGFCGLGGGNFSSSMSNISFFYPKKRQGTALGLNAGLGNLGVSVLQFLVPVVISLSLFGAIGGDSQIIKTTNKEIWIQNSAFIWIIPIIVCTIAAFFLMDNLPTMKTSVKDQLIIFKRKHMYLTTWLYVMSFGSFIGYSAAFPLLIKIQFTDVNPLKYAFLGPMVGALIRPLGGWISDKVKSGAMVTFIDLFLMIGAVFGVIYFISPETKNFNGFLIMFMVLFTTTGIANGSVFQMIPMIFPPKETAPVLGFSAAIAAYGAFFIPKSFGMSIQATGSPILAFQCFIGYYITCIIITWWWYLRKNSDSRC
jgi:NNP family nitrate/nitrite transporter-like MFS transporter